MNLKPLFGAALVAAACSSPAVHPSHGSITADPLALNFGDQTAGSRSAQTLRIHNTSQIAVDVSSVAIAGDARGAFSLGAAPAQIAAGDTASITVTYTAPLAAGADGATLTLLSDADNAPELAISLSARSVAAVKVHTLTVIAAGSGAGIVSGGGISCGPTCSAQIVEGTVVNLSASPSSGSRFSGFSGACTGPTCAVTMSADATVTATFVAQFEVTLSFAGGGSGTVDFGGAATACTANCTRSFDAGTTVSISGAAGANSVFGGFSGGCTGIGSCSVSSAKSITATFTPTHTLTVSLAGSGSGTVSGGGVSCPGSCSVVLAEGVSVTLDAIAGSGSRLAGWNTACTGASCQVTMGTTDQSVTATFVQQHAIAVTFSGDGTGTVDFGGAAPACNSTCSVAIDDGTSVTVTGTAGSTSVFTGFTGGYSGNPGFSIASVSANVSVTATFQQTHTLSVSVVGTGSISSSPAGINCTSSCSALFADGTPVTLTATPSGGATLSSWAGACAGTVTDQCTVTLGGADASATATFAVAGTGVTFGGSGDQFATGMTFANGQLWVSGNEANGAGGVVARLSLPIGAPDFINVWPASGANQSTFAGIAAGPSAVYAVGSSVAMTTDCAGGVETKMTMVKYPFGTTGAPSGYEWFSNVGGSCAIENLTGATVLSESGTTYVYGVGMAQYPNRDTVIKAADPSGSPAVMPAGSSTVWTRFFTTTGNAGGNGVYPIVGGGGVYAVGADNDTSPTMPILSAYDTAGTQTWVVRGAAKFSYSGFFRAVTAAGTAVYAVGQTAGSATDFIIERYDTAGARQWTKQFDSGSANDALTAVVALGTHLFAAGFTGSSATSGCNQTTPCKMVLLDLNATDGTLLNTTLYGDGVNDTVAYGIATDGTDLYVAGHQYTGAANGYDLFVRKYPGPGFTVGGTVTGLSGTGLVLQNNAEALPVSANGTFTFANPVSGAYSVSIKTAPTQPDSTTQSCVVSSGTGTASADVTAVQVDCTPYVVAGALQGPSAVHAAGGRVYFATAPSASCAGGNSGDAVWVVPASGGTPQSIAAVDHYAGNCGVYGLVTDATSVYWLNYADAWIKKANLDGSNVQPVAQVAAQYGNALAIDGAGGNLFYHAYPNASLGRIGTNGSGNTTFANSASSNGENLTVDATNLYWTDASAGHVYEVALSTSSLPASPAPLVSGESAPFAPFAGPSALYWIAGSALRRIALPSGTAGDAATGLSSPGSVVADANSAWVTGTGVVYKIPAAGGTPVTVA